MAVAPSGSPCTSLTISPPSGAVGGVGRLSGVDCACHHQPVWLGATADAGPAASSEAPAAATRAARRRTARITAPLPPPAFGAGSGSGPSSPTG